MLSGRRVRNVRNQRWTAFEEKRKSRVTAYLLWLFLGALGAHRFYLGMKPSRTIMACLVCVSGVTYFALRDTPDEALLASIVTIVPLFMWVLSDAFRLPGFVQGYNDWLMRRLGGDVVPRRLRRVRRDPVRMVRR